MEGKQFLMGSKYFFGCFKDYNSHDTDYIVLEDNPKDYEYVKNIRGNGLDIFYWRKLSPSEFVTLTLSNGTPMQVGKFLIPEVVDALGFTLSNLKELEPLFKRLDDKHKYEKIIYDSYLKNGKFSLTGEQRLKAYLEYRKYRPDQYN